MGKFDPYHRWLSIPREEQPPHHYRLLGCKPLEDDLDVIESAADRQMAHVRGFQAGEHAGDAQRLLNEIAAAKLVLLRPDEKAAYDAQLKTQLAARTKMHEPRMAQALQLQPAAPPTGSGVFSDATGAGSAEGVPIGIDSRSLSVTDRAKKSGGANMLVLGGVGTVLLLLLVGGSAVAFLVKPWETNTSVAQIHPPTPPEIVAPPPAAATEAESSPRDGEDPAGKEDSAQDFDAAETPTVGLPDSEPHREETPTENLPDDPGGEHGEYVAQVADAAPPADAGPKKHPVPTKDERDAARAKIEGIFPLNAADTQEKKAALAQQLLTTAQETKNDAVVQFVLLNMARELAAEAAQVDLAFEAVDALQASFDFDTDPVRLVTLGMAVKADVSVGQKREVLRVGLDMVDDLLRDDQYVTGTGIIAPLLGLARRARDSRMIEAFVEREKYARELEPLFQEVIVALGKLEKEPDNANANLTAGAFYLFSKGDWPAAMPKLAKGSDGLLAAIAKLEIGHPDSAKDEKAIADEWWKWAELAKDPHRIRFARARAAFWYAEALKELSGVDQVVAEQRIEETRQDTHKLLPSVEVYLDDAQEIASEVGHGWLAKHGSDVWGDRYKGVQFQGQVIKHSLFMHAKTKGVAYARYKLSGQYDTFEGIAGLRDFEEHPVSRIVFRIAGDGKVLWTSQPIQRQGTGQPFEVDISGVDELTLGVICGGDYAHAHCVWMYPKVSRTGSIASTLTRGFGIGLRHFKDAQSSNTSATGNSEPLTDDGLVGHWTFDEGQGDIARDSARGHHGKVANGIWTDGIHGGALSFRGDGAVLLGNPAGLNFAGDITIAAWVRVSRFPPNSQDDSRVLNIIAHGYNFEQQREIRLSLVAENARTKCELAVWRNASVALGALYEPDFVGKWRHVATTYDGREWTLYYDGVAVARQPSDLGAVMVEASWAVGAHGNGKVRRFHGDIDDVRIYNRDLTAEEIAALADTEAK